MDAEVCSSTEIAKEVAFQLERSTILNALYHLLKYSLYFSGL